MMTIERLSCQAYRRIYKDLIKNCVDYVAQYDTIEDTYTLKLKLYRKILISKDKETTSILLTDKAVYIILDKTEYYTITIF